MCTCDKKWYMHDISIYHIHIYIPAIILTHVQMYICVSTCLRYESGIMHEWAYSTHRIYGW